MKFFILGLCIALVSAHNQSPNNEDVFEHSELVNRAKGEPWPYPLQYASEPTFFTINPQSFEILHSSKCDILIQAVKRYKKITFITECQQAHPWKRSNVNSLFQTHRRKRSKGNSLGQLYNITIQLGGDCERYPYMNMDEQYLIKINTPDTPNSAMLFSTSVWGALRGLETFSQLVYPFDQGLFAVNTTIVLDNPRFPFRGLLLDTSRHFIPVPKLLENLDAMAQTKLNVFHWHIVDSQSFPYVSIKFPDLSEKGAFDPATHTYSQADVANVIEYARVRGIRVLVEFDTPGHTDSWGKGQKNLLTPCYGKKGPNGKFGPIDPTNNNTLPFLEAFFNEIAHVFPDKYIHLGGDEVSFDCWASNPKIQKFMEAHEFGKNFALLEGYYMQQLLELTKSLNKSYIVWQEVFDNNVKLKPDTVIHVWKDHYQAELANVTAAGYNTILSSCWYLNYINYGDDWKALYNCEPYNFTGSHAQKSKIIGGEACMWGEYVDGSNVITRTWPRAAAVAERLWSNASLTQVSLAAPRLEELRCTMIKRGLKVEPVNGPGYCACDYF